MLLLITEGFGDLLRIGYQTRPRLFDLAIRRPDLLYERVAEVAAARGVPQAQVALAWLLGKRDVTAPIIGATKLSHIDDAVAAVLRSAPAPAAIRATAANIPETARLAAAELAAQLAPRSLERDKYLGSLAASKDGCTSPRWSRNCEL